MLLFLWWRLQCSRVSMKISDYCCSDLIVAFSFQAIDMWTQSFLGWKTKPAGLEITLSITLGVCFCGNWSLGPRFIMISSCQDFDITEATALESLYSKGFTWVRLDFARIAAEIALHRIGVSKGSNNEKDWESHFDQVKREMPKKEVVWKGVLSYWASKKIAGISRPSLWESP